MNKAIKLIAVIILLSGCISAEQIENKTPYDMPEKLVNKDGALLSLSCSVTSKSAQPGDTVEYDVIITNISNEIQNVNLSFLEDKWAVMPVSVTPDEVSIAPNGTKQCCVKMTVVDKLPKGGHERRTLVAIPNDTYKSEKLELITVRFLEHPYMLADSALIDQAKQKVKAHDWAKNNLKALIENADKWQSPKAKQKKITREGKTWVGLFPNYSSEHAWEVALAWKITGDDKYRKKVLDFILEVADTESGYTSTQWATDSDASVHEGEFFCFYAALYDLFYNDPKLTPMDHANIENTIRLYMETCKPWLDGGDIGNWACSANVGAICCAAVLQDISAIEYFINCPRGFKEQLSLGLMGDGWWFEGASNYSYLTARIYSYAAKCVEPFGINMFDMYIPVQCMGDNGRRWKNGWLSMNFDIWGPPGKSYRCLKDLYNGATILMDENGYVAANNDSDPKKPGDVFELGYYHYKDPAFLWSIARDNRMSWQSLLYGIAEVNPQDDPRSISGHVDNVGIAALRSQRQGQKPNEQIQAFLKWGTHGGWHGHFDRASLMQLRRYGKNLLLPLHKSSWFGYHDKSYKAWIQPSISHNMVIVDQYQQEPVESELLMFYAGQAIQACAVETNARWAQKLPWDIKKPGDLDPENMAKMVDYGNAEPVCQRRLMLVTDDYVLLFDYLAGKHEHTFDWLIHPAGFIETVADDITKIKRTEKMSDDPQSSYSYITNCNWYKVKGKIVNKFRDGQVKFDVYTNLTDQMQMAIGNWPEKKPAPENLKRKTLMFRTTGKEFYFCSLLEPHLNNPQVEDFIMGKDGIVTVNLKDGRIHNFEVTGFQSESGMPGIVFKEHKDGKLIRQECTASK